MNPVNLPKEGYWIYLIWNSVNGKIYVGKTRSLYRRCHQYRYDFRERAIGHINNHLYNAMTMYGIDLFQMLPWEQCQNDEQTADRELYWIDHFDATNRDKGYNLRRDSSSGMIAHAETKEKQRVNMTRQWASGIRDGHGEKLKASWANNPQRGIAQSAMFKKYRTKFTYIVWRDDEEPMYLDYVKLRVLGLDGVLSVFHRAKSDFAKWRGEKILRVPACLN